MPDLMERVRASVSYLNGTNGYGRQAEDRKMFAFLSLFHPEMSIEKRFKLIRDKNNKNEEKAKRSKKRV